MKLYTFEVAPNPRRVALFLKYKGLALDSEEIDLMAGGQFADDFKAINPRCTVPALQLDDGSVLCDVVAICMYLEAQHPQRPLLGQGDLERAQVMGWMHRIFLEGLMAVAEMLRNKGDAFRDRALPGTLNLPQIPELVERGRARLHAFFDMLDEHLNGRQFIVGDGLSQADIDALVCCDFAGWVKESVPAHCQNLQAWYQRVNEQLA